MPSTVATRLGGTPYRGRKPETKETGQAEACPARRAIEKQQLALEVLTVRYDTYRALVSIQVATPGRGIDRDGAKPKCEAATTQACSINKRCIRMKAAGLMLSRTNNLMALALQRLTLRFVTTNFSHTDRIGNAIHNALLRNAMNTELTEEEMRRALFGEPEPPAPEINLPVQEIVPDVVIVQPVKAATKKKVSTGFTPRLRVTLRVGNEFEGKMHEIVHEADTLSSLVAEQEATKAARKKFRFVEVVSVKSM